MSRFELPEYCAVERYREPALGSPFVILCEHASNAVPPSLDLSDSDREVLAAHWGWDIGAAALTRALCDELECSAVLSGFSRLLVDPNRGPKDAGLFVEEVDGRALSFNARLNDEERACRQVDLYHPYHEAADQLLERQLLLSPAILLSIHSFTRTYLSETRTLEVGVLNDQYDSLAEKLTAASAAQDFRTERNQPYSGKGEDALIYSASSHGRAHSIPYLELEIRNDLIDEPRNAREVATRLAAALRQVAL